MFENYFKKKAVIDNDFMLIIFTNKISFTVFKCDACHI